jgi:hypothetical protein
MLWMETADVTGINQAIVGIIQHDKTKAPILFPQFIPDPLHLGSYYANYDVTPSGYDLYIGNTAGCFSSDSCNLFTLGVSNVTMGTLLMYKNMQNQPMTINVILKNGNIANYTQGYYAINGYSNPQISWRQNNATYTLSWVGMSDPTLTQKFMVFMANNLQTFAPATHS